MSESKTVYRPICGDCSTPMKCIRNGVQVLVSEEPNTLQSGDLYRCRDCGGRVIVGLGTDYETNEVPPDAWRLRKDWR